MASSSNNLATIEPWMFRTTNTDSWYTDPFAHETESALTKALQQSFFSPQSEQFAPTVDYPDFPSNQNEYCSISANTATGSTVTVSGSGSESETPGSKQPGKNNIGVFGGKNMKRKSRTTKRSVTTFIQADPANFRQMVQQVTGVKFEANGSSGQFSVSQFAKPEPVRQPYINKLQGLLPTLDTSAYLLDHQSNNIQQQRMQSVFSQSRAMNLGANDGGAGTDFYSFSSFPTLESSI
ncbi:calmodulin-binding protein 25-like [Rutidosis leptorrhynchoides]|uniref:calmodulin-binding protein 25-like n=1 Tax=Rutidosis leptorrhynchoides TaxID=125765 RepID=UPI003A9A1802